MAAGDAYEPRDQGFEVDWPHTPRAPGPGGGYLDPWKSISDPAIKDEAGRHVDERMADEAGKFIRASKGRPFFVGGRPSLGSWVSYGLGTENTDLPAFVVLQDSQSSVVNGPRNWSAGFMPAVHQGIRLQGGSEPIPNLNTPPSHTEAQQQNRLDFITQLNRRYAERFPDQTELSARLTSYELASRMQAEAPDAVDLTRETETTRKLYGMDKPETAEMGRLWLLSRRMVERGVRFVQIYHGGGS